MSGLTGKGSTSIKKKEVAQSRIPATAFRKVRALHECSAAQTVVVLTALTSPSGAVNYSAPNPAFLATVNMFELQDNVEVRSSIRGALMQNLAYVVTGASTITLQYEAEEGEVLEIVIDHVARTGATLVDAQPIIVSGTLAAGQTDFNVGTPFQVGAFPLAQHGSGLVLVDGQPAFRNTNNSAPGSGVSGDYYEVNAGGGLGTIIRFNVPDLVNDRTISFLSLGSLVEKPNSSQLALIEAVQGQVTTLQTYVQALVGDEVTIPTSMPTNVDLKAFGDAVLALQTTVASLSALKRDKTDGMGLKIGVTSSAGSAWTMSAGDLHFVRFECPQDCIVTRMSALKAAQAVGIKSVMAIYSDSSGQPSLKLGQSNEHTLTANAFAGQGGLTMYDMQSPVSLTKGTQYWLAYIQDTSANMETYCGAAVGRFVHKSITYSASLPASVSAPFSSPSGGHASLAGW